MKNSKVVSFLSPFKFGQAGNLWTLPRTFTSHSRMGSDNTKMLFNIVIVPMVIDCKIDGTLESLYLEIEQ